MRRADWEPKVGVLADLSRWDIEQAQVSAYRDLWHPNFPGDTTANPRIQLTRF